MKQFKCLLIYTCFLVFFGGNAYADYSLSLVPHSGYSLNVKSGDYLVVDVMFDAGDDNISSIYFDIIYESEKLTYQLGGIGSLADAWICDITQPGTEITPPITYFAFGSDPYALAAGNYTLATLTFAVLESTNGENTKENTGLYFDVFSGLICDSSFNPINGQYPDFSNPVNVTINQTAVTPVPLPSTLLLLGSALAGLAAIRRNTNKSCR